MYYHVHQKGFQWLISPTDRETNRQTDITNSLWQTNRPFDNRTFLYKMYYYLHQKGFQWQRNQKDRQRNQTDRQSDRQSDREIRQTDRSLTKCIITYIRKVFRDGYLCLQPQRVVRKEFLFCHRNHLINVVKNRPGVYITKMTKLYNSAPPQTFFFPKMYRTNSFSTTQTDKHDRDIPVPCSLCKVTLVLLHCTVAYTGQATFYKVTEQHDHV